MHCLTQSCIYEKSSAEMRNDMIRGKYFWNGDDLTDANQIRKTVFVDEQEMKEGDVFDSLDTVSIHAVVYDENEKAVASGRITLDGEEYRIGKIAVLKEARGQGFGDFIVRMLVDKGYLAGAATVMVRSQIHAIPFYEKIGFVKCGEIFRDLDGLEVQPMELIKGSLCKECSNTSCETCSGGSAVMR